MFLSVDIGGSAIKLAVMDANGTIVDRQSVPSPKTNIEAFFQAITPYISLQLGHYPIKGIAVSSCGAVDCDSGVIFGSSALPYLHGPNIKQGFVEQFGLPCEIENDANCAALGELWLGEAAEANDCCLVVIGSGIGGAVVINRAVTHGYQLHCGEFGYMIAGYDKGFPLTFSDVASTRGLIESAAKAISQPAGSLNGLTVFEMADQGSEEISAVIHQWYQHLATGLFNIQYCLDPELILLGGAISSRPDLIDHLNQHIDAILHQQPVCKIRPRLKICSAGNDANLIGALYHFLSRCPEAA
ncbi:ROK family protein [Photobacterium rosenbergii]|uniref:ROK family protein n=1 Tax=Photobacterium rosenbergii TaxID=294936 RepID=UPI001C991C69|nr:ROK family protein [Photobacterium rosenbergii]MBY5944702.1 ROK family protein [Photobacterium rosenbergii]